MYVDVKENIYLSLFEKLNGRLWMKYGVISAVRTDDLLSLDRFTFELHEKGINRIEIMIQYENDV